MSQARDTRSSSQAQAPTNHNNSVRKATPDANDDHGDSAPSQESQDSGVFGRLRRFLSNTADNSLTDRMKNAHDSIKNFAEGVSLHSSDDSL